MKKLALLLLPLLGCEKDEEVYLSKNDLTVIYAGNPMVDGCGWMLRSNDDKILVPKELDPKYQTENLKVNIKYKIIANDFFCSWSVHDYPVIEIKSIRK